MDQSILYNVDDIWIYQELGWMIWSMIFISTLITHKSTFWSSSYGLKFEHSLTFEFQGEDVRGNVEDEHYEFQVI